MTKLNIIKQAQLTGHLNSIYALGLGKENNFYTGAADGFIVAWHAQNPGQGKLLVNVKNPVYSFLFLAERNLLLAGTATGNLHVIDLIAGKEIKNIVAHTQGIFDIKLFNHNILTAGGDGKINVWDADFNLINQLAYANKSARVIAVNNLHKTFAAGYSDNIIRIYNPEFKIQHQLTHHTNSVFALSYNPNSLQLLSGGRDAYLLSYAVSELYNLKHKIPAHTLHINYIAFNASGSKVVTVSMDKTIKIWDSQSMQLLKVIDFARYKGHTNSVNKVLFINETEFVTCSDDKTAMLWKITVVD